MTQVGRLFTPLPSGRRRRIAVAQLMTARLAWGYRSTAQPCTRCPISKDMIDIKTRFEDPKCRRACLETGHPVRQGSALDCRLCDWYESAGAWPLPRRSHNTISAAGPDGHGSQHGGRPGRCPRRLRCLTSFKGENRSPLGKNCIPPPTWPRCSSAERQTW